MGASLLTDWRRIRAWADTMEAKGKYPTVIIGSGLGGLCCGAYLAKQGIPVTVVEERNIGGYACCFSRRHEKFTFDVALHGMTFRDNITGRILQDLGVMESLELAPLPEVYFLKTPDLDIAIPQRNPEKYIRSLSKHFPSEKKGIRGFIEEVIGIVEESDKLYLQGKPPDLLFPFKYPKLYRVFDENLDAFINRYTKTPALQSILSSLWDFHGLPPSQVSAMYYAVAMGDMLKNGTYYVKPRSRDLSHTLARVIEDAGGKIITGMRAEKILVKKNGVTGVKMRDGEVFPARAVVCSANALDVFKEMVPPDSVPGDYLAYLKGHRPSLSSFIVWLGLNQPIRSRTRASGIQVVSAQGPEADYCACLEGDIEKIPFRISLYDNMYPNYSKPGTSTLRIVTLCGYEPWKKFKMDYREGVKEAYNEEKQAWAKCLVRRAEKIISGLSTMIEVEESATPLTNWRFTRNPKGAIYGFEQSVDNAYFRRIKNQTPIKGLYLASAWSNPGGGFSGVLMSGQIAFRDMMKDWGEG
jgi:prolycopene isomerase